MYRALLFLIFALMFTTEGVSQVYSTEMKNNSQKYITYAYLANKIYTEGETSVGHLGFIFGEKWKLVRYKSETNGFQAGIYRNLSTDKYIVAVGGTTANPKEVNKLQKVGGSILDINTDLRLLSNLIPDGQSKSVLEFIKNKVISEDGINKIVTIDAIVGHSLGGGLAAYAGLYDGIDTFTFNPSPVPITGASLKEFYGNNAVTYPNFEWGKEFRYSFPHANKITNIMSNNDPVSNISFLLENTDNKYYNATNLLTIWNNVKVITLFATKELHVDYANIGKNIWLPIETGHSMSAMLEKMKDAKSDDDYNKYMHKWAYLEKKIKAMQALKFTITSSFYNGKVINIYFPNEKAIRHFAINDVRILYNRTAKMLKKDTYSTNYKFINGLGLGSEVSIETDAYTDLGQGISAHISYKEYMKVISATYKKLFGISFFVRRFIESKNNSWYSIYKKHYEPLADSDVKNLYRNIFLLHFVRGVPRNYLSNDGQEISNAFMINFFYKFFHNVVKYRNLKLK